MRIKTIALFLFCLAAFFVFQGASVWEGSAAMAPNGDLPGRGFYAATNSFPRNTVVDITNLENNKSIRVIVAGGLDSPGLLALISRDAAQMIEINSGSIGRIRMTQPSDPIAFSRFTEGLAADIPDYDSGAVITQETYRPIDPSAGRQVSSAPASGAVAGTRPANSPTASAYVLEPEWGGTGSRGVMDLPDYYVQEETPYTEPERISEYIPEDTGRAVEDIAEPAPAVVIEEAPLPPPQEDLKYTMVPAEEYLPPAQGIYGIDPANIIPGIEPAKPAGAGANTGTTGISTAVPSAVNTVNASAVPVPSTPFTVDTISKLEQDSYYVQIAALPGAELVESAIGRIDRSYRPVVYNEGDRWYRILLGPLNLGESGAVLQRFKSIGYKDAFVRQGK